MNYINRYYYKRTYRIYNIQDNIRADRWMMKKYGGLLNIINIYYLYLSNDERVNFMSILLTDIKLELILNNT